MTHAKAASKKIPENARKAFIEDILEDLKIMDQSRLRVLGITAKQLESWQKKYNSTKKSNGLK